jgi:acyl-CoA dehydrogenase
VSWDFSTDPELATQLEWVRQFVRDEILPLEAISHRWRGPTGQASLACIAAPLKEQVKQRGLWAAHLPPDLGGGGWGQVPLALLHEVLGATPLAPPIFGNQAPDSGNAELLALGGSDAQKRQWLDPLLAGEIYSCFAMTEPGAGADPTLLQTTAVRDGDGWNLDGHKWFISNAAVAAFHVVMARTGAPSVSDHRSFSMFLVPSDSPGLRILRDIPTMAEPDHHAGDFGGHSEVRYDHVRLPVDAVIGEVGDGFALAQARLGPGRIHHAMRWLGQSQRAFDMLCERAVSRVASGSRLADKQFVQDWVAESYAAMQAARLLTLQAAWRMDQLHAQGRPYADAKVDISMIKFWGGRVLFDVIDRAIQVHGALGFSTDLPLESMYRQARAARLYDGPDEVHKVTVARQLLRGYTPVETPSEHLPTQRAAAEARFVDQLEQVALNA